MHLLSTTFDTFQAKYVANGTAKIEVVYRNGMGKVFRRESIALRRGHWITFGRARTCDFQFDLATVNPEHGLEVSRVQATLAENDDGQLHRWTLYNGRFDGITDSKDLCVYAQIDGAMQLIQPCKKGLRLNGIPIGIQSPVNNGDRITFAILPNLVIEGYFFLVPSHDPFNISHPTDPGIELENTVASRQPLSHIPAGAKLKARKSVEVPKQKEYETLSIARGVKDIADAIKYAISQFKWYHYIEIAFGIAGALLSYWVFTLIRGD